MAKLTKSVNLAPMMTLYYYAHLLHIIYIYTFHGAENAKLRSDTVNVSNDTNGANGDNGARHVEQRATGEPLARFPVNPMTNRENPSRFMRYMGYGLPVPAVYLDS